MLLSRHGKKPVFKIMTLLPVALGAALSACGGGGPGDDTREPRGVLARVYNYVTDTNGTTTSTRDGIWQRPGSAITFTTPDGGQVDTTGCDLAEETVIDTSSGVEVKRAINPDPTLDSRCFVKVVDSAGNTLPDQCLISAGLTRYTSRLGAFEVMFINNTTEDQQIEIQAYGVNIRIQNAATGAEVWNMEQDNADYQDLLAEVANLFAAKDDTGCSKITAITDGKSLPPSALFGATGSAYKTTLFAANTFTHAFYWNGKDQDGVDVPAGNYIAYFDIKLNDTTTGQVWPTPNPVSFTIADAVTP